MTSAQNTDRAAILRANRDQSRWLIDADTERLDDLLDDAFVAVHITGHEQSKAEWLEQIRSGRMAYHDVQQQAVCVDIDGDSAVLTVKNLVTAIIYGSRGTWPLESITTYAKKNGTWRATRSRATTY